MWNLGSSTPASQSDYLTAEGYPIYVAGCPVVEALEKSSPRGYVSKGAGCSKEGSSHPITSRQPGARVSGQAYGAERHREDRKSHRTSQNSYSTHFGE
jgi:hypothetical protein